VQNVTMTKSAIENTDIIDTNQNEMANATEMGIDTDIAGDTTTMMTATEASDRDIRVMKKMDIDRDTDTVTTDIVKQLMPKKISPSRTRKRLPTKTL
jgi:hypothetical protein